MKLKRMASCGLAILSLFCMATNALAVSSNQEVANNEQVRERAAVEAQAKAQWAAEVASAKAVAYMDLDSASAEMQAQILEARETVINSKSWIADGYEGYIINPDGTKTPLPKFSELFPGWDLPVEKSDGATVCSNSAVLSSPDWRGEMSHTGVRLRHPSSSNTAPFYTYRFIIDNYLQTKVTSLSAGTTSCNLGYSVNGVSIARAVEQAVNGGISVWTTPGEDYMTDIQVRASTYVREGTGDFLSSWY